MSRITKLMSRGKEATYEIIKGSTSVNLDSCHLLQFDGASNPNPGPSSAGAVIFSPIYRKFQYEQGVYMPHATNNEAEYTGFLTCLRAARELKIQNLLIEGDSQLVIYQIIGRYKIKNELFRSYWVEANEILSEHFNFVGIRHIYRHSNRYADGITKYVLKTKKSYIEEMASSASALR